MVFAIGNTVNNTGFIQSNGLQVGVRLSLTPCGPWQRAQFLLNTVAPSITFLELDVGADFFVQEAMDTIMASTRNATFFIPDIWCKYKEMGIALWVASFLFLIVSEKGNMRDAKQNYGV